MEETRKRSINPILVVFLATMMVFAIVGLSIFFGPQHIEDQNGEDTSLAVLTKEDIAGNEQVISVGHSQKAKGNTHSNMKRYEEEDKDQITHKFKKVSGVTTLHATKTRKETLTLTITSTLQSGNMELAIIVDGEYYCNVPINQTSTFTLDDVANKLVLVRLGGESARAEISVSRK